MCAYGRAGIKIVKGLAARRTYGFRDGAMDLIAYNRISSPLGVREVIDCDDGFAQSTFDRNQGLNGKIVGATHPPTDF